MTLSPHDETTQIRETTGKGKGRFAGNIPTAPPESTELVRPLPEKTDALKALHKAQSEAYDSEDVVYAAASEAVREAVENAIRGTDLKPVDAIFRDVNDYDGYDLCFAHLADEDGNPVELGYEAEQKLSDQLQELGDVFKDFDYNQSRFESFGDDDGDSFYRMDVRPVSRTVANIDRELAQTQLNLDAKNAEISRLLERQHALSVEGFTETVQKRFGSARTAFFLNTDGGPRVVSIADEDQDAVWDLTQLTVDGEYEDARLFIDSLHPYTSGFDLSSRAIIPGRSTYYDFELDLRSPELSA